MYSPVAFITFTVLDNHPLSSFRTFCHSHLEVLYPLSSHCPISPQPLATTKLLSVFILPVFIFVYLSILDISYKWDDTVYITFCIWLLSRSMFSRFIYVTHASVPSSFFFLTFVYFWLLLSLPHTGFSLVVESRGYSLVAVHKASHFSGCSCCGA